MREVTKRSPEQITLLGRVATILHFKSIDNRSPVYDGWVPAHVIATRRRRNRAARVSRRINRRVA